MSVLAKLFGRLVSALVILAAAAWGALALFYRSLLTEALRAPVAGLFGLSGIVAAVVVLFSRRAHSRLRLCCCSPGGERRAGQF